MNPLSPFTYYLRHKRHAALLLSLIALGTVGLFVMVSMLDSLFSRVNTSYLTQVSYVAPLTEKALEPGILPQIQVHPAVEQVIPVSGLYIYYPVLLGNTSLKLMGVFPNEAEYLTQYAGLKLTEGRMFAPRSNEIVLAGAVARALNLRVGDEIDRSVDKDAYGQVVAPLKVVGILQRDPAGPAADDPAPVFGFISGEYLDSYEAYASNQRGLLVVARPGRLAEVNAFLEGTIASKYTDAQTIEQELRMLAMARQVLYLIFGIVNSLVAVIVALVVAAINRIALLERLDELGVLNALGFNRSQLIRRMVAETSVVASLGWLIGLIISLVFLAALRDQVFYPRGIDFEIWNLSPFLFVIPIPLAVIISAWISVRKVFANLDAVQIVERGKLSTEDEKPYATVSRSSQNPLSPLTFYQRHPRRAIGLVVTMALMILGVAFPAFFMLTSINAIRPSMETYRRLSIVSPTHGKTVDVGLTAQIRSQPDIKQVLPAISLYMGMNVPPMTSTPVDVYAVTEQDLPLLVEQLGVTIIVGHLPRPRSNDLVISQAIAANYGLKIGDRIGGPEKKDDLDNYDIPVEMVITGILGPDLPWVGLASYEFLQNHELSQERTERLLVLPYAGKESSVQAWLTQNAITSATKIQTYQIELDRYNEMMLTISLAFAIIESLIAFVAAIALAALNYIFFNQRRDEFGILYAIGRNRLWLISRIVGETGSIAFSAWLVGAALSLLGLFLAQIFIYAPIGLNADMASPIPWLFTLPIPLAVVLVSSGSIGRMLSRLDPVAIVEMKA